MARWHLMAKRVHVLRSCVFVCVCVCVCLLRVLQFPPTVQRHAAQVDWRLEIACRCECECVHPVTDWQVFPSTLERCGTFAGLGHKVWSKYEETGTKISVTWIVNISVRTVFTSRSSLKFHHQNYTLRIWFITYLLPIKNWITVAILCIKLYNPSL